MNSISLTGVTHPYRCKKAFRDLHILKNLTAFTSAALGYESIVRLGMDGMIYQWGGCLNYSDEAMPVQMNGFKDNPPVFKGVKPIDFTKPCEVNNKGTG